MRWHLSNDGRMPPLNGWRSEEERGIRFWMPGQDSNLGLSAQNTACYHLHHPAWLNGALAGAAMTPTRDIIPHPRQGSARGAGYEEARDGPRGRGHWRRRVDSNHCMEPCGPPPYLLATPPGWFPPNTTPCDHTPARLSVPGKRCRGQNGKISRSLVRGEVLELADRHDLGSCAARRGSSSLPFPSAPRTRLGPIDRPGETCLES